MALPVIGLQEDFISSDTDGGVLVIAEKVMPARAALSDRESET